MTDLEGRLWRVWDTRPEKPQLVRPGYENGWLSFETDDGEKRRLVPFPAEWFAMDEAALAELLNAARQTGEEPIPPAAA